MSKISFLNESLHFSVGNKALRLHELSCAQFPVPMGFVLTDDNINTEAIKEAIGKIGGFPVAARSSGTIEDLGDASFAGMYETYLEIETIDELIVAIKNCFESAKAPRVQDYLKSKGHHLNIDTLTKSMRVLVQRMVNVDRAGVLFTIHPFEGKEESQYIEVCAGLGERLVSGHVTPSRYSYNWLEKKVTDVSINEEKTILNQSELEQLTSLATEIQGFYEHPQDIEFAIDMAGKLWILQSRPVTHVSWRKDVPELTNADFKDGGVSARVCPPMMYSIYERAIQNSMGRYFEAINLVRSRDAYQWIYYFYGRAYWNAGAVKEALSKIPGFDEESFDRDLGIVKDYGTHKPEKVKLTIQSMLAALNALCGLNTEYHHCRKMIDSYVPWFEGEDRKLKNRLKHMAEMDNTEFWQYANSVFDFQFLTECNYFRTIYNNSNTQSDFKNSIKKTDPKGDIDFLKLLSDLPHMAHMEIQADLLELVSVAKKTGMNGQEWHEALERFMEHHYHHGDAELDLTVPRWGEKPERVAEIVAEMSGTMNAISTERIHWMDEWHSLERANSSRIGWQLFGKGSLWKLLLNARDYLVRRELMRTLSTRAYFLVRRVLVEGEKRLGLKHGEIHLLTCHEFLRAQVPPADVLNSRRNLLKGYKRFSPPNEFGGALKVRDEKLSDAHTLQGIGCSTGEMEGFVRVILTIGEASQLQSGEILVTKFTDPGWTPVMARAGAVITEVGGVLSHAAVIGREYKIPAILNVNRATHFLKTGQRIRVNGRTGIITRLEENT